MLGEDSMVIASYRRSPLGVGREGWDVMASSSLSELKRRPQVQKIKIVEHSGEELLHDACGRLDE